MGNSDSSKPGSGQPGGTLSAAAPAAADTKPAPTAADARKGKAAGRIVHDERGNAVWDWLKDTARIAIDSTSRLLMRLDAGGGYDPYGKGITNSPTRKR